MGLAAGGDGDGGLGLGGGIGEGGLGDGGGLPVGGGEGDGAGLLAAKHCMEEWQEGRVAGLHGFACIYSCRQAGRQACGEARAGCKRCATCITTNSMLHALSPHAMLCALSTHPAVGQRSGHRFAVAGGAR